MGIKRKCPHCGHEGNDFKNGIVLDPFSGMATVAKVAIRLGRKFIGYEPSVEYHEKSTKLIKLLLQQTRMDL